MSAQGGSNGLHPGKSAEAAKEAWAGVFADPPDQAEELDLVRNAIRVGFPCTEAHSWLLGTDIAGRLAELNDSSPATTQILEAPCVIGR